MTDALATDVFADVFGDSGGAMSPQSPQSAFDNRGGGGGVSSYYQKQRRGNNRGGPVSLDDLYDRNYESSSSSGSGGGRRKAPGGRKRKQRPDDGDEDGAMVDKGPASKRRKRNDGSAETMTPADMAKFMFANYYVTGGNWIVLNGRANVKMSNPSDGESACRAALTGVPDGRGTSLKTGRSAAEMMSGAGTIEGGSHPPSRPSQRRQYAADENDNEYETSKLRGPRGGGGPTEAERGQYTDSHTGQFSASFSYDVMMASKIASGTMGGVSPAVMMANSNKPVGFRATMHPIYQKELIARMERFAADGFDPDNDTCPICLYGACDRQAALAGNANASNNAIANFFVIYTHDRPNVNEQVLYRAMASYWNRYIYMPFKKVNQVNGAEIRPSHVEFHFSYCMECSNPVALLSRELREADLALKTMRQQGLYMEQLNYGTPNGEIFVSPLLVHRVRDMSRYLTSLVRELQAVSWNEQTLARKTQELADSTNKNITFDSGQASYGAALNQFGKAILHKKALGSGSLL